RHDLAIDRLMDDRQLEKLRHDKQVADIEGQSRPLQGGVSANRVLPNPNEPVLRPLEPQLDPRGFPQAQPAPPRDVASPPQVSTNVIGRLLTPQPPATPQTPSTTPPSATQPYRPGSKTGMRTPDGDVPDASPNLRFSLGVTEGAKQVFEDWLKGAPQN